jgi:hypothetical protein
VITQGALNPLSEITVGAGRHQSLSACLKSLPPTVTGQAPWPAGPVPPQGLDVTVPNVALIHDHLLGGKDNFEADRDAARQLQAAVPNAARAANANRAFLAWAIQLLVRQAGIRQFLEIGTGLPTRANVHEIAQIANRRRTSCTPTSTRWWCSTPTPCRLTP